MIAMSMVEVKNVVKRYGNIVALNGLTFSMSNEILGLIGPNGAGKTTTLKILLGLIKANAGSASIFGRDCWNESFYIHQRMGVLHEKTRFLSQLTVGGYLEFVASLFNVKEGSEITRVLRDMGIYHLRHRKISGLSAGETQRLGLAQAIIAKPQLILLDEPTSNLDPVGRREFLEVIWALHRDQHTAFLICSHVLHELEQVCDRFVIIHRGRVLATGVPKDISQAYNLMGYEISCRELQKVKEKLTLLMGVKDILVTTSNSLIVVYDAKFKQDVDNAIQSIRVQLDDIQEVSPPLDSVFKEVIKRDGA